MKTVRRFWLCSEVNRGPARRGAIIDDRICNRYNYVPFADPRLTSSARDPKSSSEQLDYESGPSFFLTSIFLSIKMIFHMNNMDQKMADRDKIDRYGNYINANISSGHIY